MTIKNSLSSHQSEEFSMAELVERTNTSSATIRYYFLEGLLPAPIKITPNKFLYDERHVEAVLLVRLFRERRQLSIEAIKRLISDLLPDLHGLKDTGTFRPEMWKTILDSPSHKIGSDNTKQRLLQAGLDQISQIGFDDLTIDDVCRKAEVAKGTFYNYFTSKEDFFIELIGEVGDELKATTRQIMGDLSLSNNRENRFDMDITAVFENDKKQDRGDLSDFSIINNAGVGKTPLYPKDDDLAQSFTMHLGYTLVPYLQIVIDLLSLSIRRRLSFEPSLEALIQKAVPKNFETPKQIFISAVCVAISEKIS